MIVASDRQSPDIAQAEDTAHEGRSGGSEDPLDRTGAGDQGMQARRDRGHFGRTGDFFTWERTDKADQLRSQAGLN